VGKFRKLFFVAVALASFVITSPQPAHARSAWKGWCESIGGYPKAGPKCIVDGVDVLAGK
jgi:hypothetical protein